MLKELDDFLSLAFVKRSGGGIGLTRLMRIMEKLGLIPTDPEELVASIRQLDQNLSCDVNPSTAAETVESKQ